MPREIDPLGLDDLAELSAFLTRGFQAPADAAFAAPDVLRWKYFDPRGVGDGPRSFVAREDGRIVGHVGVCPTTFQVAGDTANAVSTLHLIDWLAAEGHAGVGGSLMRRAHRGVETQFGFGGSAIGRSVIKGAGYRPIANVPIYRKVLRYGHRLRIPGQRLLGIAKDVARGLRHRGRPVVARVAIRKVDAFGPEVDGVLAACALQVIFTCRRPDLLNHALRYPRGTMSGWLLTHDDRVRGFALLNVVPRAGVRVGKIVDCFLDCGDVDLWHAAIITLTRELKEQAADLVESPGSTPWMEAALRRAGYYSLCTMEFSLRDKRRLLPGDLPFHLTFLEADYAYT